MSTKNSPMIEPGQVVFVGAGPGDPELLTIAGHKAIAEADLVVYAGSLVPVEILAHARSSATIRDSAGLTLEDIHALMKDAASRGEKIARVHTGDPALYGTLTEQIRLLEADGISWKIIPGITAASAAAAAAGISFTNPEISQSLIITRSCGQTPMPANEDIAFFARHKTAMAIYLSAQNIARVQNQLLEELPRDTPVLCARRVGWPEQKIIWTTVGDLAQCAREHGLDRQTVFIILPGHNGGISRSRLYDAKFSHMFRKC